MRLEWQGRHPHNVGRLWSYGLTFEEWAAEPSGAMRSVAAECVQATAVQESGQGHQDDPEEYVASEQAASRGAAAEEVAAAEAKASIAYIKSSPAVRDAWITWLEEQTQPSTDTRDQDSKPVGASSARIARAASGLASVGFDPALHTQDTRARFCAVHQREHATATTVAPTSSAFTTSSIEPNHEQTPVPVVPVVVHGVAHLVLICVHSHNRFTGVAAMERIRGSYGFPPTALISLPCCHQFNPTNDLGKRTARDLWFNSGLHPALIVTLPALQVVRLMRTSKI